MGGWWTVHGRGGSQSQAGGLADALGDEHILQTGDEHILQAGDWGADDPLHCLHDLLYSSVVGSVAIPIQNRDADDQDALDGAPVEGCEDVWREMQFFFQASEEV